MPDVVSTEAPVTAETVDERSRNFLAQQASRLKGRFLYNTLGLPVLSSVFFAPTMEIISSGQVDPKVAILAGLVPGFAGGLVDTIKSINKVGRSESLPDKPYKTVK